MAVCESSCFLEPIVIYERGNVINLYQTVLEKKLDFKYVAVDLDQFDMQVTQEGEQVAILPQTDIETLFQWPKVARKSRRQDRSKSSTADESLPRLIELMSVSQEEFAELSEFFPWSAARLKDYSVR